MAMGTKKKGSNRKASYRRNRPSAAMPIHQIWAIAGRTPRRAGHTHSGAGRLEWRRLANQMAAATKGPNTTATKVVAVMGMIMESAHQGYSLREKLTRK